MFFWLRISCIILPILGNCLYDDGLGTESQAQLNVPRMQQLRKGMTEEEVREIMQGIPPASTEQIILNDGRYDIWFYITKGTGLDQSKLSTHNLTPVIFKNDVLIGMGYNNYKKLLLKQEREAKEPVKEDEPVKKEDEPAPAVPPLEKILEKSKTSMCSKPTRIFQEQNQEQQKTSDEEEEQYNLDTKPEDRRMLEDEQEEDFNLW